MRQKIVSLLLLILSCIQTGYSQSRYIDTLDFHQIISRAYQNPEQPLLIENIVISEHNDLEEFNNFVNAHKNEKGRIPITQPITFRNCLLMSGRIELNYCDFKEKVSFEFCMSPDDHHMNPVLFVIQHCNFTDFEMLNCECSNVDFEDCEINQSKFLIENTIIKLQNTKCTLPMIIENDRETDNQIINIENSIVPELQIIGDYKRVKIRNSKIQELKISADITQEVNIANNEITKAVYLQHTALPEISANVKFYWSQLAGYKLRTDFEEEDTKGAEEESNELEEFEELNSNYQTLLKIYKDRGDLESANACYVELKRVETGELKHIYGHKPSLDTFIRYQLNSFLDTFCEYGTNTVKSILYSVYVILFFAFIYVLFPSEEDGLYSKNIFETIRHLGEYFSSDPLIAEKTAESKNIEILALQEKLAHYKEIHKNSSPAFKIVGFLFYLGNMSYFGFNIWILTKLKTGKGNWKGHKAATRIRIGFLVYTYFFFYFMGALLLRITNAVALSINAFVTLGYGEISAKGISRYLAVIEGFLGWFLLSIFSVSLLSQILQS
jgi:hypothetical protein